MRLREHKPGYKQASGYTMWLSARDTAAWACRPGECWPCSVLAGKRCRVVVDLNGLLELTVNGHPDSGRVSQGELVAIVADHLPTGYRHMWPTWE